MDYLNFIKACAKHSYRIGLDREGELAEQKRTFWESIFGVSQKKRLKIYEKLTEEKELLASAFQALYYSDDENQRVLSLSFQKALQYVLPKKEQINFNLLKNESSNWIENLPDAIKKQRLDGILLPGTHDSGAYHLSGKLPQGSNGLLKRLLHRLYQIPFLGSIVKQNTLTQKHSIKSQLEKGVRQFDFRLAMGADQQCYLAHTFLCNLLEDELNQIKQFLEAHKKEIIIIHIKRDWPHKDNFKEKDFADIVALLNKLFEEKIYKKSDLNTIPPTIEEMQQANKNLILCSDLDGGAGLKDTDCIFWNNKELWPDQSDKKKVLPEILKQLQALDPNPDSYQFIYASLNTTPNAVGAIKQTLLRNSLISSGKTMQKDFLSPCLQLIKTHNDQKLRPISSVMFDGITKKTIQEMISTNRQIGSEKSIRI